MLFCRRCVSTLNVSSCSRETKNSCAQASSQKKRLRIHCNTHCIFRAHQIAIRSEKDSFAIMPPKRNGEFFPSPIAPKRAAHVPAPSTDNGGEKFQQQQQQQQQKKQRPEPKVAQLRRSSSHAVSTTVEPQRMPSAQRRAPSATFGSSARFADVTVDGYISCSKDPSSRTPSPGPLKYQVEKSYEMASQRKQGGKFDKSERFHFPSPAKKTEKRSATNDDANNKNSGNKTPVASSRGNSPSGDEKQKPEQPAQTSDKKKSSNGNVVASSASTASPPRRSDSQQQQPAARKASPVVAAGAAVAQSRSATPQQQQRQRAKIVSTNSAVVASPAVSARRSTAPRQEKKRVTPPPPPAFRTEPQLQLQQQYEPAIDFENNTVPLPQFPSWTGESMQSSSSHRHNNGNGKPSHYSKAPAIRDFSTSPFRRISSNGDGPHQQVALGTPRATTASSGAAAAAAKTPSSCSAHYQKQQQTRASTGNTTGRRTTNGAASPATSTAIASARSGQQTQQQHSNMSRQRRFSSGTEFEYHTLEDFFSKWLVDAKRRGAL